MATIDEPLVLSRTAIALLRIARENDRSGAIAYNAALEAVIEFTEPLINACGDSKRSSLLDLLGSQSAPRNFLELVAAILRQIRDQLDRPTRREGLSAPAIMAPSATSARARAHFARDFDRHVLQGLAEAIADLAWPDRKARDFDGPPLDECCARLAECDVSEFWLAATQHYLANILQHYFAAARVREHFRKLDLLAESNLRVKDARALATRVLRIASGMNEKEAASARIAEALESVLQSTVGGESPE